MSADNGYILRRNFAGKYVLQMYFLSDDEYPPISDARALTFTNVQDALEYYEAMGDASEYGLIVHIKDITEDLP